MAERLKDQFFTEDSLNRLVEAVQSAYPAFDREQFLSLIYTAEWDELPLKGQMYHTTRALHAVLPGDYAEALAVLRQAAPHIRGFEVMCLPDYVEQYGQHDWEGSMPALRYFTRFGSAEFAVRPFLDADPERGMAYLLKWAQDENEHVRRLASEGCRPRLPWAMALPKFKQDPALILPVLEKLKDDESEMVRRSVANNLNDISKDHPELVLDLAERWYGHSERTDALVRHALRGLLKAGNRRALRLFGIGTAEMLQVTDLTVTPDRLKIGEDLMFRYRLYVQGDETCRVRLEYALDFVKARGEHSRKIFQHSEKDYAPGEHVLEKKHSMVDRTTRKHYPGVHRLAVIVNGEEQALTEFVLEEV